MMATQASGDGDRAVLSELEGLVRETYTLWDEEWVGFSWRNYTYDHVQRVRALARTIGAEEGADDRVLNFAGLLHDITKAYDGEIITDEQGNRVLDENGFWQNETLVPARENVVTEVYDRLDLAGQLHNVSGARLADWLLSERGYPGQFRGAVGAAIEAHLQADERATVEGRSLYDADTIDANIGMPAFYRNIQIGMRRQDVTFAGRGESFPAWLRANLADHLHEYLTDRVATWIDGKRRDFIPKMTTAAGRQVAEERIARLTQVLAELHRELDDLETALAHGGTAVVRYFMENRSNPALSEQLELLTKQWLRTHPAAEGASTGAASFLVALRDEVEGRV